MSDLVEFLRARLDEDEQTARGACVAGDLTVNFEPEDDETAGDEVLLAHIGRWDPARVLAEVEAKREILKLYSQVSYYDNADESSYEHARAVGLGEAVRLLTASYVDHPDYDPDWKVSG